MRFTRDGGNQRERSRRSIGPRVLIAAGLSIVVLLDPGCSSKPKTATTVNSAQPSQIAAQPPAADPLPDTAAEALRLEQAMARTLPPAPRTEPAPAAAPTPEVRWLDETTEQAEATSSANQPHELSPDEQAADISATIAKITGQTPGESGGPPAPATQPIQTLEPEPAAAAPTPKPEPKPAATPKLDRGSLLDTLLGEIAASDRPALAKALTAAMVSLTQPGREVPHELIEPLSIGEREQVARFQSILEMFNYQLTSGNSGGDGQINREDVDAALDEMFGALPIAIKRVDLCKRVNGFGVYEPFESRTFLAGRDHKMIIYLELDNFQSVESGSGQYEVRLEQELALYTEWDGQKVWQHDPVELVDVSRNKRRDFYTIQIITLPARLSVGKYILKVDVTDKHGGSVDGKPVEIKIVADQALVRDDTDKLDMLRRLLAEDEDKTPLRPTGK